MRCDAQPFRLRVSLFAAEAVRGDALQAGWGRRRREVIQRQSEAIVLRTWPFHEADLLVSFFTREQGKVKGIARSAMKSRKRFGGALEPMTHVVASYVEKPRQDLVRIDSFEVISTPLSRPIDYGRTAGLQFVAEVLDDTLQEHDPQDAVFRLALAVLEPMQVGRVWMPLTYFALWVTRLMGWMPELTRCSVCGGGLRGVAAYYHPSEDGLLCAEHRRPAGATLSLESVALATRIFSSPITAFAAEEWPRSRALDLRRFVFGALERHLEHRLSSARALAKL